MYDVGTLRDQAADAALHFIEGQGAYRTIEYPGNGVGWLAVYFCHVVEK